MQRASEHRTALTIEDTRRRTTSEGGHALEGRKTAGTEDHSGVTVEGTEEHRGRREFTRVPLVLVFYEVQMNGAAASVLVAWCDEMH